MESKKQQERNLLELIYRARPSQIPFHCTKESYNRSILHADTIGTGLHTVWACRKNGNRMEMKVTWRNIWNRDGTLNAAHVPVGIIYCPSCDQKPQVKGGDPAWVDEITTLSL